MSEKKRQSDIVGASDQGKRDFSASVAPLVGAAGLRLAFFRCRAARCKRCGPTPVTAAAYNGTKAFVDSFSAALRNEIKDTDFFARADMLDTKVGADEHARAGPAAVAGMKSRMLVAMSKILPSQMLAEQHRKMAQPGTARNA